MKIKPDEIRQQVYSCFRNESIGKVEPFLYHFELFGCKTPVDDQVLNQVWDQVQDQVWHQVDDLFFWEI